MQIVGDGTRRRQPLGSATAASSAATRSWSRSPRPRLPDRVRDALLADAGAHGAEVALRHLGTFEFLVDDADSDGRHVFIEANPRLQVEHTVTEEVTGVDLVRAQLELAGGAHAGRARPRQQRCRHRAGIAVQVRVNMETMAADGTARPAGGMLTAFELPSGAGLPRRHLRLRRLPHQPRASTRCSPRWSCTRPRPTSPTRWPRPTRALAELRIEGVPTNIGVPAEPCCATRRRRRRGDTRFVDDHIAELRAEAAPSRLVRADARRRRRGGPGRRLDSTDPLAVLDLGKPAAAATAGAGRLPRARGPRHHAVGARCRARSSAIDVAEGDAVPPASSCS